MLNTHRNKNNKAIHSYERGNTELCLTVSNGRKIVNLVPCLIPTNFADIECSTRLGNIKLMTERIGCSFYLNIDWACINLKSISHKFKFNLPGQILISWKDYRALNILIPDNAVIRIMYVGHENRQIIYLKRNPMSSSVIIYSDIIKERIKSSPSTSSQVSMEPILDTSL